MSKELFGEAWEYEKAKMRYEMHDVLFRPSFLTLISKGEKEYKKQWSDHNAKLDRLFKDVRAEADKLLTRKNEAGS